FSLLSDFQIPAPYKVGIAYDAVCVNPLEYLPWLRSKLKSSVANKQRVQKTGLLVNATSLGPRSLIGVEDTAPLLNREQFISTVVPSLSYPDMQLCVGARMSEHVTCITCPGMIEVNAALLNNGTYQIGKWDIPLGMSVAMWIFERCSV
ncbi:uncharacterized protein BJ212DRAFT_1512133, partial [Suillus subaureus]